MSEKQPENPQAFPYTNQFMQGMTLRDYIAAAALPAVVTAGIANDWPIEQVASFTYEVSDALLRAREAK